MLPSSSISGNDLAEATVFIKMFVNVLRTGEGWEQFDAATEKAHNTKWYPMLHVPPKDNWFWSYYRIMQPRASHSFNIEPEAGQPFEWWHMAPGFPNLLTAWINQRIR